LDATAIDAAGIAAPRLRQRRLGGNQLKVTYYLTIPDAELDKAGNRLFTDGLNNLRGNAETREFSA
jgi:hypothetical protein